jgi:hypothetical protein
LVVWVAGHGGFEGDLVGEGFFAGEGLVLAGAAGAGGAGGEGHHELVEVLGAEILDGVEAGGHVEAIAGEGENVGFAAELGGVFADQVEVAAAFAGLGVAEFGGAFDVVQEPAEFGEEAVKPGAAIDVGEGLEAGALQEGFAFGFGLVVGPVLVFDHAGPVAPEAAELGFGEEHVGKELIVDS